MEIQTSNLCRDTDILCIAGELLERWERLTPDVPQPEPDGLGPVCLPCVLQDENDD